MNCSFCKAENPDAIRFCGQCGHPLFILNRGSAPENPPSLFHRLGSGMPRGFQLGPNAAAALLALTVVAMAVPFLWFMLKYKPAPTVTPPAALSIPAQPPQTPIPNPSVRAVEPKAKVPDTPPGGVERKREAWHPPTNRPVPQEKKTTFQASTDTPSPFQPSAPKSSREEEVPFQPPEIARVIPKQESQPPPKLQRPEVPISQPDPQPIRQLPRTPEGSRVPSGATGLIIWTGRLDKMGELTINNGSASYGSINQGSLPGVPISVTVEPSTIGVAEFPSPSNGWHRIVLRSPKKSHTVVQIKWTAI